MVSFGQKSVNPKWLVGTWKTCQDTAFSLKYKGSTYTNTYVLKPDGTYFEPETFADKHLPRKGTWAYERDTLFLKDANDSFGAQSSGIEIVDKNLFYSKVKSNREYVGYYIYNYFVKQD